MRNSVIAGAICLFAISLCAGESTNAEVLAQKQEAKRLLSERTRQLGEQQDANAAAKAGIRNLRNVVSQEESVLLGIENPSEQKEWRPEVAEVSTETILDIKLSSMRDLPKGRKLPAWASFADAPDGLPSLKFSVDVDAKEKSKGLNTIVLGLPRDRLVGRSLVCSAKVKADDVEKVASAIDGGKLVLHYTDSGKASWPGASIGYGSFDWKDVSFSVTVPNGATDLYLVVGLQGVTGTIYFRDLKVEVSSVDKG